MLLTTRNLTAHYGDFQALFGVDFEVDAGEMIAIIGANGAGKSTFLKTLTGLIGADYGDDLTGIDFEIDTEQRLEIAVMRG